MIGADADAVKFFSESVYFSANIESLDWNLLSLVNGTTLFINVHALVQFLLGGPDFLLAHAFSLLGAAIGLWLLNQIWLLIFPQDKKYLKWLILLYTFYPSVLMNQSYILREVWQNICILGLGWLALKIKAEGWSLMRSLALAIFLLFGSLLHTAMPLVMVILCIIFLTSSIGLNKLLSSPSRLLQGIVLFSGLIVILYNLFLPLVTQSAFFDSLSEGRLLERTEQYGKSGLLDPQDARAQYGNLFFANQPLTIVPTFLAYQLMPLPPQITTPADVIAFIQNLFRVWLIWVYWRYRNHVDRNTRNSLSILFLMWLVVDIIYATGTINWGTASRHHIKSFALLLVSGLGVWSRFKENLATRKNLVVLGSDRSGK
ncbi:hypothetical protein B7O87_01010 [Cylindrospermopsis raciborskii CENA303]|uniref:Glycosyltransferase RgtA/B/C/D-like domain-containing protein n=2 Tax=Cylindrospermopsis raciborskii TaxID=77022 RepID=A0A1X4GIP5_9CYAN|nr:hypothetical protein B7O87_01010 [Cylindrospermopsis raciborskii CENA303]